MSLFDIFSSNSDADVGNEVLQAYFYEAQKYPEFTYGSYEAWLTYMDAIVPDFAAFIGKLVNDNYASTTVDQAKDRVRQLANSSIGQAKIQNITAAAGGKGDQVNWAAGVPEIVGETAKDAAQYAVNTAQAVGQGVMSTTALLKYLPWILGAGAALYIVTVAKGHSKFLGRS